MFALLSFGVALVAGIVYSILFVGRRARNYPPGPSTLPLIGNLHQIPLTGAHRQFTEWAKKYGGIFSLKLGPGTAVVLTDRRLVKSLLDKKSSIYSNRPSSYVAFDLITKGDHLLVMNYGDTWRCFRKLVHQHFMESMVEKEHLKLQNAEAVQMLRDFCVDPLHHMLHPRRFNNSTIMGILFGIRSPSYESHYYKAFYHLAHKWTKVMETGATPPVDIYPFLKLVPERFFNNWRSRASEVGDLMEALYSELLDRVISRREQHGSKATFMDKVLDQQEKLQLTRSQLYFLGGVLLEGGSDTSSGTILAFMHAMIKWPEVQRKAQAEIDSVVREDRSPVWSDWAQLRYVRMIVKEVMRWRPVAPLGFPHSLAEDDRVDSMFLPKGTTIMTNTWGLHHDEARFPDPDNFIPERYAQQPLLASEYAGSADYNKRDHYGYGAGRRICPGIHLAERSLFLAMAKLLWGFEFSEALDCNGNRIPLDVDPMTAYDTGLLNIAKDFNCRVVPRSEKRRQTILREFAEVQDSVFSQYEDE
ncbi:MAG: hypothetical protein M1816_004914 [Peltula sp. TS41687]|nr:MAG: hypothetical protein M1816_004914 [Peltula sp. TS41687]